MIIGFSGFGDEQPTTTTVPTIPGAPNPIDVFAQTQAQQGQSKICGETWCLQRQDASEKSRAMSIAGGALGGFVVGALVMGIFS